VCHTFDSRLQISADIGNVSVLEVMQG